MIQPPPPSFKAWVKAILYAIHGEQQILKGQIMTMNEQLQQKLDAQTAASAADHAATLDAITAINYQLQQTQDLIAQLSTSSPPTQAQLDQLQASIDSTLQGTAALVAATQALHADDPAPAPTPVPTA